MSFSKSIFGSDCSVLLNNFLSPLSKYNELTESYINLKQLLISGQTKFPKLTLQLEELIDINNLTYLNVFTKLTTKVDNIVTGYSKTKIYEKINQNIDLVLDDLNDEYKNIVIQLQTIYDNINKNVNDYKLLIYLLTNIDTILRLNTTFESFDLYNSLFRFLYEKNPLTYNYNFNVYSNNQLSAITTLIPLTMFKRIFYTLNPFTSKVVYDIYNDPYIMNLPKNNYMLNLFYDYIDNNVNSITSDLIQFVDNTIYNYGVNVSPSYVTRVSKVVSKLVLKLKEIVRKNMVIIVPADYVYRIIDGTINNSIISTLLEDLLTNNSFVWKLNEFSNWNESFHDKVLSQWEQLIVNNIYKYLNKNFELIELINYIHTKFASNPIFAINAHAIVYAKMALNYLDSTSAFTNENVEEWLNVLLSQNDTHINNIISYCSNYNIKYHDEDINFISFLVLQEFITNLINCSDFNDFVVQEFIPIVDDFILHEYKSSINWYKKVDDIKYIFKLILCNDLIAALNGNSSKLFFNIKSTLVSIIQNSLTSSSYDINKSQINSLIQFEKRDLNKWYNIFNSFYKNSVIAHYVSIFLQENYSI